MVIVGAVGVAAYAGQDPTAGPTCIPGTHYNGFPTPY